MSLTDGPIKDDVMAWEPKKLADYMRQVSWFMRKKVNLCTSFSSYALMFYNIFYSLLLEVPTEAGWI